MSKRLALVCTLVALTACHSGKTSSSIPLNQAPSAAQRGPATKVPLRLFGNLLIVEVADSEGTKHSFVLDTGASFTVLDKSVAKSFQAKPYVSEDGSTLSKKVSTATGEEVDLGALQIVPSMKIGDFELHGEVGAYVADLTPVRYVSGLNIRGILGFQSLQLPFTIDYVERELRLNVQPLSEGAAGVLALQENDALYSPQVTLSVGDRQSLAMIDTGSGECMAIPANFGKTLSYSVGPIITGFSQNIGGITEDKSGRLKLAVDLAGHTVAEPIVDLIQPDYYRLGGSLLRNFKITFDPERSLVHFARAASGPARCDSVMSIGFYVGRTNDQWVVALLLPGAEGIDIKPGDQLLSINGSEVTDSDRKEMRDLWKAEKKITVSLKRGSEVIERLVPVRTLVP